MAAVDLAAFRAQQAKKNAALLASLDVLLPAAPAVPVTGAASPMKKPRASKPKAAARPAVPESAEAQVADRETRGLRSSARVRDQALGLTPKKEAPPAYAGQGVEERGYYEDGRYVRAEKAPKKDGKYRKYDPKRPGAMPGVAVNTVCLSREEWWDLSVHSAYVAGICNGKVIQGAPVVVSICTGGANYGDADEGESLTYSGSGGRDLKGTSDQRKNLRTAPQTRHMRWDDNPRNAALLHSVTTRTPIRVLRSWKGSGPYAPVEGYIYSGLYVAVRAFTDKNEQGLDVCRVALVRMPGQPPLAIHPERAHMVKAVKPARLADATDGATSTDDAVTSSALSRTASASTDATTPEPASRKRTAHSSPADSDAEESALRHRRSRRPAQ